MNKLKKNFKQKDTKGITLIALVITIIVLLILAGVTINSIVNQDSSMDKAAKARLENKRAEAKDAAALAVTELIQEYYEKRFIDSTSNASCPGDYVVEVLEEEGRNNGPYMISVESDILEVEDEDDVLATGTVEDSGAIVWDGTPRAVTASVNPWNNLATEDDVVADLFYYEIIDEPQATGKVDGVEEKAKVADTDGNIKIADAETDEENYGTARITGINVDKLASFYSEDDYCKTYTYSDYSNSESSWDSFFHKYYDANVVGDYNYSDSSGTYYYNVPGSGRLDLYVDSSDIEYYGDYYIRASRLWDNMSYADLDAFVYHEYYELYKYNYTQRVVNMVYNDNINNDGNEVYWDNYPNMCSGYIDTSDYDLHEVYRCTSDYYYNGGNEDAIKNAIYNYVEEHPEQFAYHYVKAYCDDDDSWVSVNYEEDQNKYFTTNSFSPYFIQDYSTTPTCFNKFVIPHIYEKNGKKYKITEIDFSDKYGSDLVIPYVGDKISKFYIPNSVTSINFGYGEYDYKKTISLDTVLIPGGVGRMNDLNSYFRDGISVKKVVIGEGITEINANDFNRYGLTDVYLPKSLTNITGNWTGYYTKNVNVHYAGKKGAWSRVTGNKPQAEKVTFRSVYTNSNN